MTHSVFQKGESKSKKQKDEDDEDEIVLDWWTKYFASVHCFRETYGADIPALLALGHVEKKNKQGDHDDEDGRLHFFSADFSRGPLRKFKNQKPLPLPGSKFAIYVSTDEARTHVIARPKIHSREGSILELTRVCKLTIFLKSLWTFL